MTNTVLPLHDCNSFFQVGIRPSHQLIQVQQARRKLSFDFESMDQHVPDKPAVPNGNANHKAMVFHDGHYLFGNQKRVDAMLI